MVIFFLVPFGLRGARMAVQRMKNDVKDWLPSDFEETTELDWFRDHFLGEQFVVASWEGCTGAGDDDKFKKLINGFFPEIPPSFQSNSNAGVSADYPKWKTEFDEREFVDKVTGLYSRQLQFGDLPPADEFIGNRFGLYATEDDFFDWGGRDEKWILGQGDRWYFLLPDGKLFRWHGGSSVFQPVFNATRKWSGKLATGDLVAELGPVDGPWYYEKPARLSARLFKSVTTGPGVLSELTKQSGSLEGEPEVALQRLKGFLFGPDGRQTCLVATLTEAAKADLRKAIGRGVLGKPRGKLLVLADNAGIGTPAQTSLAPPFLSGFFEDTTDATSQIIKLGGPPVDNVAIDEEGQITLVRLVGLSLLVGLGLSWLCFRSINITIMVFFVGGISAVVSLSFVFWSDSSVDAVLMSMPSLVFVLGLSGAVHIVNYYREAVHESGLLGAPEKSLAVGWKPCALAAFTTSLGLISLYASNILPIRKFGLFSALGVLATLILLFSYLPSALQMWPPRRLRMQGSADATRTEKRIETFWLGVGSFVVKHNRGVAISCLVFMAVLAVGIHKIQTDVQLLKMFDSQSTIIQDYGWLEKNLGKLVPLEVVVKVRPAAIQVGSNRSSDPQDRFDLDFLERLEITQNVDEVLKMEFGDAGRAKIGQTMLATTFAPELPPIGAGTRNIGIRSGFTHGLEAQRDGFVASDYLRTDKQDGSELWRISLRLPALDHVDYGQFVHQLKEAIEPVMSAYRFRREFLNQLASREEQGSIRNQRVMLLGAEFPTESVAKTDQTPINQTAVFSRTLWKLLTNAGLQVDYDSRYDSESDLQKALATQSGIIQISGNLAGDYPSALFFDARDHRYEELASRNDRKEPQNVSAIYTGVVPVVFKAQQTLLYSLIESTGWAFVMIAIVMMFLLRSAKAGLLSMLPNVFPVIAIFGIMGWTETLVDIGSMMTASVAMGVAVDDTIHFLTWFRKGLDDGMKRQEAIRLAYLKVATAMTQTTAIGGLGLSIFALSTFTPTQRFGTLMLALLIAALVGDLIFLPALLASPFGRLFDKKKSGSKPTKMPSDSAAANNVADMHHRHEFRSKNAGRRASSR